MTDSNYEAALTRAEVAAILEVCGTRALLVGGQALAIWASIFDVVPTGPLSSRITSDADFIAPATVAAYLQERLGTTWSLRVATLDDIGGQNAKVFTRTPIGIKQVEFLTGIVGLDTERVQARAVELQLASGARLRVLHPLDILESRLRNLQILPGKRDEAGVAQAALAVAVARRFIESELDRGATPRRVHQAINRVVRIALDAALVEVALNYDLEVLSAVPAQRIAAPRFQAERWPRVLQRMALRRAKHAARAAPRTAKART